MKTGTAIALMIGVPTTIGVIAWAVLANKIVDKVPPGGTIGGGGGSSENCGELIATDDVITNMMTAAVKADPLSFVDAADFASWLFRQGWPSCSFGPSTKATFIGRPDSPQAGHRVEWSVLRSELAGLPVTEQAISEVVQRHLGSATEAAPAPSVPATSKPVALAAWLLRVTR